ncbi:MULTISPECIES: Ig-like domain-containing protein [unclassified Carboxylicivirga]|uniref:Ig-like domain-containing protein n=1 Tax=Carboxylicivirga TaxID=1628153 RepID=UPI003D325912
MMKKFTFLLLLFLASNLRTNAQTFLTIEAENATLSDSYDLVAKEFASGGNFVKLKNTSPEGKMEFVVPNVSTAGTYKLHVYSFNGGISTEALLSVNGVAASTVTLQPSNWAYEDSAKVTYLDINLEAGNNTVEIAATSAVNVLIDKVAISEYFNVYYVSTSGSDANNGSVSSPWQTIAKVNEAAATDANGGYLGSGDKVLFKRGDYFEGQLLLNRSGTADRPIEIGSYGAGELPVLSGSGTTLASDYIEAVKMTNTSHILVNNIWIKNDRQNMGTITWGTNTAYGIKVIANKWGGVSEGLTFRNLKITDVFGINMLDWEGKFTLDYYTAKGIFFDATADDPELGEVRINDVLIENCYFYNLGSTAISCRNLNPANNPISEEGRNMNYVIRNNTFEQLGGDGVVFASVCNGLVEKNTFIDLGLGDKNSSTDRLYGRGEGCWIWDSHNIIVQFNKQLRNSGFGDTYGAGGHVDFFCKNAIFQYNYSEETAGGFCEILGDCENSTFRYNVSVNDGYRDFHGYSIWVSGYVGTDQTPVRSNNNYIYNNTIYIDKAYTPDISIWAENTYVYNNIFKAVNGGQIGATGVDIDIASGSELVVANNLFYGDVASAFTNLDNSKITGVDPQFVNQGSGDIFGYQIQPGSAVIDAGTTFPEPTFPMAGQGIFKNISLNAATDIYGNAVDINNLLPNIGADNNYNSGIDPSAVSGVSVSPQSGTITVGGTLQLTETVMPSQAANKSVTWLSDNTSVATVDANGLVTAVSEGTAIITVTTVDGGFTATADITVTAQVVTELLNASFEDGLTNWNTWNNPTIVSDAVYGSKAVKLTGKGSVNQWVDVKPNTTYTLSAFAKVSDPQNDRVVLGVEDASGTALGFIDIYDTNYTAHRLMFTTGANDVTAKVYFWRPANGVNDAYCDEMIIDETAYILNSDFEKGLHAWDYYGGTAIETLSPVAGTSSLLIDGKGGSSQWIKTKGATTYEITFTTLVTDVSKTAKFHVKNSAGTKYFEVELTDTQTAEHTISFTTDAGDTDSQIGFWTPNDYQGQAYLDNVSIVESTLKSVAMTPELSDNTSKNRVLVYPNPASDNITIQGLWGETSLLIYNLMGSLVLNQVFDAYENGSATVSVDHLAKGTYLLIVTDETGMRITKKLVIK